MMPSTLLVLLVMAGSLLSAIAADEPVPLGERTFRVIRGTESPDKRFALGVGRVTERAEKGKPRLLEDDSAWNAGVLDTGDESIANYLVDLREQVILAETGMGYVGTNPDYNRSECRAYWSPDNRTVLIFTQRIPSAIAPLFEERDGALLGSRSQVVRLRHAAAVSVYAQ
jgi:hypothetical protein